MAASGRSARNAFSACAWRRPSGDKPMRGSRPYSRFDGLWTSPWRASQMVVPCVPSVNDNLRHRVEDAQDEAAGQDGRGGTVLFENLVQQPVTLLEDFEDDRHDDNRDDAP